MADALIFGANIKFDKTGGVTDKDINDVLNRIQTLVNKKELWVKLGIDPNSQVFLRNYGKSADELEKKLRLVAKSIQDLQKRGKYWDANGMTAQAQRLQQTYHELSVLRKTSSLKANEFERMIVKNINEEVKAQEKAEKAAQRKAEAMKRAADKQASALQKVNGLFGVQDGYIQSLIARLATYASIGAIGAFLTKVREVTAEFELQRVSLGAIIQDQNRANALFSEIKSFALKSPVKILDLTRYTKQLAAYQIETEKLFETTKRLTDVSVGLGVDMSRLILAYGETKASNVMNAKELRQFAMMGIPMLELLSEKLSEIYGKTISTGEAFQMIKKRMVHFDVVAQIFEDLTNKGGTFYNMQEKQGNTLYGMWAKLGDAASVMYDQIGNTEWVNNAMKGSINLLRSFMLAWRDVGRGILVAATAFVVWKVNSAIIATTIGKSAALKIATDNLATAHLRLNAAMKSGNTTLLFSEKLKLKAAQSSLAAARANGIWATSWLKLRAAMLRLDAAMIANWPTIAITAIGAGLMWLSSYIEKANKLKKALNEIQISSLTESSKSVRNFESLANAAVKAKDGSKAQRDALEELHTTYGKILPQQDLQIEKLRELKGNYTSLTETVREYVAAQKQQEGITTILEDYAPKIKSAEDTIKKVLRGGFNYATEFGEDFLSFQDEQVDRMIENAKRLSKDTSLSMQQVWEKVFKMEGIDFKFDEANAMKINLDLIFGMDKLTEVIREQEKELGEWDKDIKSLFPTLGNLAKLMNEAQEEIENADYHAPKTTFLFDEEKTKKSIEIYVEKLKEALNKAGLEINLDEYIHFNEDGKFDRLDWSALQTKLDELSNIVEQKELELRAKRDAYNKQYQAELAKGKDGDKEKAQEYYNNMTQVIEQLNNLVPVSSIKNMAAEVQGIFEDLVPKDVLVRELREKLIEISGTYGFVGEGMDKMRQYFWSGEKDLKSHIDELDKEKKKLKNTIYGYKVLAAKLGLTNAQMLAMYGVDLEEQTRQMEALGKIIDKYKEFVPADAWKKGKGSKQSDPRLQILNNIASTMEKINKEYDDLLKKEGQTKALADTQKLFEEEFANLQKIANKYKFKLPAFEVPKNASEVKQWYDAIIKEIKRLGIKDADKVLIDLGYKSGKVPIDELQKDIERKLKDLQSRIEQSKTAKEFYDKILSATGDVDIAANVTMSIYGDTGEGLFEQTIAQIREVFKSGVEGVDIPIDLAFDLVNQRIDYGKLAQIYEQYQNQIIEANRDTAQKIISEGQKTAAQNILNWEKELAKAKDYEQQRTDIIKQETERRANIIKSNLPEEEKQRQISLSYDLQAQKLADLDVKEFKGSEDFIKMFEDLDNQATSALKRMRDEIQKVIDTEKDMSPENMKAMVDALQKINDELQDRNPFGDMINGAKGMFAAIQQLKVAKDELRQARAEYDAALPSLDADIDTAQKEKDSADEESVARENELLAIRQQMAELNVNSLDYETQLTELKERELMAQNNLVSAQLRQNQAQTQLVQAVNAKNKAEEKVTKAQKKTTDAQSKAKKEQNKFVKGVQKAGKAIETTRAVLEGLEPILGDLTSEATTMGDVFTAMVNTVQTFTAIMELVIILQEAFNIASESNPWIALAAAILAVTAALAGFISAQKVKKANKIIEEQQKILDQLEYTYGRLQNAADKLFGTDYIQNYNQQLDNLQAKAEAYRKQMEAEQSKGKKADKDKIKEYENAYIETLDEIADRQQELMEKFTGSTRTDAAREFAQSWLEAKVSFENTADAIKEKYKDLIQNMIIEGAAAKVIDNILAPMWDAFNTTLGEGNVNKAIEDLINGMDTFTMQADNAMNVLYQSLLAKGYDLQEILGEGTTDLTGISRDIATASEESINGLAQGINTQNYYISHVPTISENVAAIRILMEGGAVAQVGGDYNTLQNEHLAQLPIIAANTLATAERCERAAVACEEMADNIRRVVVFKGGKAMVETNLN